MRKSILALLLAFVLVASAPLPALAAGDVYNYTFSEPDHWLQLNYEWDPFLVILTVPSGVTFTVDVSYVSDEKVRVLLELDQLVPFDDLKAMTVSNAGETLPTTCTSYSGTTVYWTFDRGASVGYLYGIASNCALTPETVASYAPGSYTPDVNFDYVPPEDPEDPETWLSPIGEFFQNAIDGILDGLKRLFVPSDDYFKTKMDELVAELPFISEILLVGTDVKNFLDEIGLTSAAPADAGADYVPPAPVLSFEVDAPNSSWWTGGPQTVTIDFSWYAPYKPLLDTIIGAFMILGYLWHLYRTLPSILAGAAASLIPMIAADPSQSDLAKSDTSKNQVPGQTDFSDFWEKNDKI